uniref:C2H2-type domain-containing protein n=1 Tax=Anopheles farauti TaxID=69004 RepID=A0A182QVC2_9DIPT
MGPPLETQGLGMVSPPRQLDVQTMDTGSSKVEVPSATTASLSAPSVIKTEMPELPDTESPQPSDTETSADPVLRREEAQEEEKITKSGSDEEEEPEEEDGSVVGVTKSDASADEQNHHQHSSSTSSNQSHHHQPVSRQRGEHLHQLTDDMLRRKTLKASGGSSGGGGGRAKRSLESTAEMLLQQQRQQMAAANALPATHISTPTSGGGKQRGGTVRRPEENDDEEDDPSSEKRFVCPICEWVSPTQRAFTEHIRLHNAESESATTAVASASFCCKICSKVLSSASSLDRHVLVHTGERPFNCKYCSLTFTTNGNMHRHMRTHKYPSGRDSFEGETGGGGGVGGAGASASTGGGSSSDGSGGGSKAGRGRTTTNTPTGGGRHYRKKKEDAGEDGDGDEDDEYHRQPRKKKKRALFTSGGGGQGDGDDELMGTAMLEEQPYREPLETDEDMAAMAAMAASVAALNSEADEEDEEQEQEDEESEEKVGGKQRKGKLGSDRRRSSPNYRKGRTTTINNNLVEAASGQRYCCPVCERNDFASMLALEQHLDQEHPSVPAKCRHCDVVFRSHKTLNAHRCSNNNYQNITPGFKDLTFVDFSSEKFPLIAKNLCEQSIRTPVTSQKYECARCYRAFPSAKTLAMHAMDCGGVGQQVGGGSGGGSSGGRRRKRTPTARPVPVPHLHGGVSELARAQGPQPDARDGGRTGPVPVQHVPVRGERQGDADPAHAHAQWRPAQQQQQQQQAALQAGSMRDETEDEEDEEQDVPSYDGATPVRHRRRRRRLQSHLDHDVELLRRTYTATHQMAHDGGEERHQYKKEETSPIAPEQPNEDGDGHEGNGDEEEEEEETDAQLVIDEDEEEAGSVAKMPKLDEPVAPAEMKPSKFKVEANGSLEPDVPVSLHRILKQKLEERHPKEVEAGESVAAPVEMKPCKQPRKVSSGSSSSGLSGQDESGGSNSDLVPVAKLLDNATNPVLESYFSRPEVQVPLAQDHSDEEGLVASGSASESNNSGTDDPNPSAVELAHQHQKKKSAYSLAPNRVSCPYCQRMFPWSSSLRRHILTHTGQKPFKCSQCTLLFTTKSNCDRHLLRKHGDVESAVSIPVPIDDLLDPKPEPIPVAVAEAMCKKVTGKGRGAAVASVSTLALKGPEQLSEEEEAHQAHQDTHQPSGTLHKPNEPSDEDEQRRSDGAKEESGSEESGSEQQPVVNPKPETNGDEGGEHPARVDSKQERSPDVDGEAHRRRQDKRADVVCAFCMRRFWSTEDLRRHMRTHSGERPFQCDVCNRRFTLKHSMLRHWKKHGRSAPVVSSIKQWHHHYNQRLLQHQHSELIGNLLGISDQGILSQVLLSSASEAAKLLGVDN